MMPLAAYADRLSVRPGETIRFHVANSTGATVSARVARVVCADANPAGPGIQLEPTVAEVTQLLEAGPGSVPQGSYAAVDGLDDCLNDGSFTFVCRIFPTRFGPDRQALLARMDLHGYRGIGLLLENDGRLRGLIGNGGEFEGPQCEQPLAECRWYIAWLRYDAGARELRIGYTRIDASLTSASRTAESVHPLTTAASPNVEGPLLIAAADHATPTAHFNGKLERPVIYDRALSDDEIAALARADDIQNATACWDFSQETHTDRIIDMGPKGLHGKLVNTPVRGVTGSNWSGREMCFRHAPAEYGAIHFHDDDIDDCAWPPAFEWTVPADTRSAVYALMLDAGGAEENVPFHVVPPKGRTTAPIAVLASTFTYTVYGNHARPEWGTDEAWMNAWREQSATWGGYPHNSGEHREYGLSTYNKHSDGSGISIASWHRPMLNVRIGYLTYPYEDIRGSGLRHFPADSHLCAWLESKGHAYDVVTDWELHHEGVDVLKDYQVVMTGSHPEYHTRETLDALQDYRDAGGRFCYMGGNGFYWKVALSPNATE